MMGREPAALFSALRSQRDSVFSVVAGVPAHQDRSSETAIGPGQPSGIAARLRIP
jgi:hypothetical protein